MRDSMDVSIANKYQNHELLSPKNKNGMLDKDAIKAVNRSVAEKPKGGAWVQPKRQPLTLQ